MPSNFRIILYPWLHRVPSDSIGTSLRKINTCMVLYILDSLVRFNLAIWYYFMQFPLVNVSVVVFDFFLLFLNGVVWVPNALFAYDWGNGFSVGGESGILFYGVKLIFNYGTYIYHFLTMSYYSFLLLCISYHVVWRCGLIFLYFIFTM